MPYRWKTLAAGSLAAAGLVLFAYLLPLGQDVLDSYRYLGRQRAKIASASSWERDLTFYKEQEARLVDFLTEINVSVPREDQMSAIVELIYRKGKQAGVRLRQMRPLPRTERDMYVEIPLTLEVEGGFHRITTFLNTLEQARQLIKVSGLTMAAAGEGLSGEVYATLELTVTGIKRREGGTREE